MFPIVSTRYDLVRMISLKKQLKTETYYEEIRPPYSPIVGHPKWAAF